MDHPATYLAQRVRARHELSACATTEELLAVCHARGATVRHSLRLPRPGLYLPDQRAILLRGEVAAAVLAHELLHYLLNDEAEYGVYYVRPDFHMRGIEREAEEFARLLCG